MRCVFFPVTFWPALVKHTAYAYIYKQLHVCHYGPVPPLGNCVFTLSFVSIPVSEIGPGSCAGNPEPLSNKSFQKTVVLSVHGIQKLLLSAHNIDATVSWSLPVFKSESTSLQQKCLHCVYYVALQCRLIWVSQRQIMKPVGKEVEFLNSPWICQAHPFGLSTTYSGW